MMRIAAKDDVGNARAIRVDDAGNVRMNLATSEVAIPVDLQFQDLSSPLPVTDKRKIVKLKEHINVDTSIEFGTNASLFIGNSVGVDNTNIHCIDISGHKNITFSLENNTSEDINIRGLFYARKPNVNEGKAMAYAKNMDITVSQNAVGSISCYGGQTEEVIDESYAGLKTLETPPFPYIFFQIRRVTPSSETITGTITAEVYGVER